MKVCAFLDNTKLSSRITVSVPATVFHFRMYFICFTAHTVYVSLQYILTEYLLCVFCEIGSQDQKSSLSSHENEYKALPGSTFSSITSLN